MILGLNKGDEINLTVKPNHKNSLIRILCLVGVLHNIKQALGLNRNNNALK